MKPDEKDLLIKEMMTRIPYGLIVATKPASPDYDLPFSGKHKVETVYIRNDGKYIFCFERSAYSSHEVDNIKPYLRSFSSMTEEEDHEFALLQTDFYKNGWLYPMVAANLITWLLKHRIDYNGLIEKGLALEAPFDMYKEVVDVKQSPLETFQRVNEFEVDSSYRN